MTTRDHSKGFQDPLMADLERLKQEKKRKQARQSEAAPQAAGAQNSSVFTLGVLLLVVLSVLGYFLYRAQEQIETLSGDLSSSRAQLGEVSATLEESRGQITRLNDGLQESEQQLTTQGQELRRYQNLYTNLKTDQEDQTRELQALSIQKADQHAVNELRGETATLRENLGETSSRLERAEGDLSALQTRADRNQASIGENQNQIVTLQTRTDQNAREIGDLRRSLEREYYNFELQEGGGYMKVFSVALSLKDADVRKKQFDMYLLAGGKVVRKKDQSINEPIFFYVEGQEKPYEVVVTDVRDKLVVGYLSIPKS